MTTRRELIEQLHNLLEDENITGAVTVQLCRDVVYGYCALSAVADEDEREFRMLAMNAVAPGPDCRSTNANTAENIRKLVAFVSPYHESVPPAERKLNAALVLFRALSERRVKLSPEEMDVLSDDLNALGHKTEAAQLSMLRTQIT